jgi:hypothetical protein
MAEEGKRPEADFDCSEAEARYAGWILREHNLQIEYRDVVLRRPYVATWLICRRVRVIENI